MESGQAGNVTDWKSDAWTKPQTEFNSRTFRQYKIEDKMGVNSPSLGNSNSLDAFQYEIPSGFSHKKGLQKRCQ